MNAVYLFPAKIPRRSRSCCREGEKLVPGMSYHSIITETGEREDYCCKCWKEVKENHHGIQWKSEIPTREKEEIAFGEEEETLIEKLQEASQEESTESEKKAFVIALYLTRKKILSLRQKMLQENGDFYLYEVTSTEEMIWVKKVDLTTLDPAQIPEFVMDSVEQTDPVGE